MSDLPTVVALYIDPKRGPYPSMTGVDAWGVERDATTPDTARVRRMAC